ncbi:MAG: hypothetical protein HY962_07175 [Ignavibacteriae bacterium]|nr:hypothetical protein [Ignavibacteriota bacterium]
MKHLLIVLALLVAVIDMAAQPRICRITGELRLIDGSVAAGARLRISRLRPAGSTTYQVLTKPVEDTADANGIIAIDVIANSVISVWSPDRFPANGYPTSAPGIDLVVPDADAAVLGALSPAPALPSYTAVLGLPIMVKHGSDSALARSVVFTGSGVGSVLFDAWTATVTITGGAGAADTSGTWFNTAHTRMEQTDAAIAAAAVAAQGTADAAGAAAATAQSTADGAASAAATAQSTANGAASAAATAQSTADGAASAAATAQSTANGAASAAATAQSTADGAASTISSHAANTNNPHSVTAAQVGAPTTSTFIAEQALNANEHAALRDSSRGWRTFVRPAALDTCIDVDSSTAGLYVLSINIDCIRDSGLLGPMLDKMYARSGGSATLPDSVHAEIFASDTSGGWFIDSCYVYRNQVFVPRGSATYKLGWVEYTVSITNQMSGKPYFEIDVAADTSNGWYLTGCGEATISSPASTTNNCRGKYGFGNGDAYVVTMYVGNAGRNPTPTMVFYQTGTATWNARRTLRVSTTGANIYDGMTMTIRIEVAGTNTSTGTMYATIRPGRGA